MGTTSPAEKLDVAGNIKLNGEVNRPATGTANLEPICFGFVAFTGNFTVQLTPSNSYRINITAESYSIEAYTTIVTPISNSANPRFVAVNEVGTDLLVLISNAAGALTPTSFHFVVYRQ